MIANNFTTLKNLGCAFPEPFPPILAHCQREDQCILTGHMRRKMIGTILKRMGLKSVFLPSDLIFSMGSMYWYRPEAFRQFFEFDLFTEEFLPEPTPVNESLAHALERMFPFVARENGYDSWMYKPVAHVRS